MKTKELTKEWLVNHGVTVDGTTIYYKGKKGKRKLKPFLITKKHKYGAQKEYLAVGVYLPETQKVSIIVVHRIIYAWYKGIAHAGLVIDHIDGNTHNNNIENLREITQKDNLNCRNGYGHNNSLYYGMGGLSKEEIDNLKKEIEECKEYVNEKRLSSKLMSSLMRTLKNDLRLVKLEYEEEKMKIEGNIYTSEKFKEIRENYLFITNNLKDGIKSLQESYHKIVADGKNKRKELREKLAKIRENGEY